MASTGSTSAKSHIPPRTCLCSPSTHPGSFRCSRHRSARKLSSRPPASGSRTEQMAGAKERSIRAILMQMIRPSSHDLSRRMNFQPKPSRFSLLDGNGQGVAVV